MIEDQFNIENMTDSKKSKLPLLMSGMFYWYDLDEYPKINVKQIKEEFEPTSLVRGNIIPNDAHDNEILIFDILETDDSFGASCRAFLYKNGDVIGKIRWMDDKGGVPDSLKGTYKKTSKNRITLSCVREELNGARDGVYVELRR